jgi:putative transposase
VGQRVTQPNELWHVDLTIIKLLDGNKVYLHAVIDNFSRRILAWCIDTHFNAMNTVTILQQAARNVVSPPQTPILVTDAGVENLNKDVDDLVEAGWLSRVVALRDVLFSNSMIEAFWRTLKHQWLYLNTPDAVRRLVAFYVNAHNTELPDAAFRGQTPDEMYFGTGNAIPDKLDMAKKQARAARIAANQAASCRRCRPDTEINR